MTNDQMQELKDHIDQEIENAVNIILSGQNAVTLEKSSAIAVSILAEDKGPFSRWPLVHEED